MKDPSHEILQALYDALNGNVSYNTQTIPVYTRIIEWEDRSGDQMIQLSEVTLEEDGAKDTYISKGTVDIYIDTFYEGKNEGSWIPVNAIANSLTQLIEGVQTLTNFTQVLGRVMSIESFDYELDPAGSVFRKLITYQFIIQED